MKTTVIIPAAGSGTRMNTEINKLFLPISGDKCVLFHTLNAFILHPLVDDLVIACKNDEKAEIENVLSTLNATKPVKIVEGGETRAHSVMNALSYVSSDVVLVHDGARPFIDADTITRVIEGVKEHGAVIPVVPVQDTVKKVAGNKVTATLSRDELALVQTPQGFLTKNLKLAYQKSDLSKPFTDDASIYEQFGEVFVVDGDKRNLKITTPQDLPKEYRSGVGFDAHRFETGRALILGGITVPHEKGLLGHSDADVVLHALMDAILSALHLRDIGYHFPCTPEFKDASSVDLLNRVLAFVKEKNAEIVNVSIVIVAEKPKLSPVIDDISCNLARLLNISYDRVSLTATTTEKLGFTGREEGIASEAVVLLKI